MYYSTGYELTNFCIQYRTLAGGSSASSRPSPRASSTAAPTRTSPPPSPGRRRSGGTATPAYWKTSFLPSTDDDISSEPTELVIHNTHANPELPCNLYIKMYTKLSCDKWKLTYGYYRYYMNSTCNALYKMLKGIDCPALRKYMCVQDRR